MQRTTGHAGQPSESEHQPRPLEAAAAETVVVAFLRYTVEYRILAVEDIQSVAVGRHKVVRVDTVMLVAGTVAVGMVLQALDREQHGARVPTLWCRTVEVLFQSAAGPYFRLRRFTDSRYRDNRELTFG